MREITVLDPTTHTHGRPSGKESSSTDGWRGKGTDPKTTPGVCLSVIALMECVFDRCYDDYGTRY